MNDECLIQARYEIEKLLQPDGYYIATTESKHQLMGFSFHIEVERLLGALCAQMAVICSRYEVVFSVTGKGHHAVVNIGY